MEKRFYRSLSVLLVAVISFMLFSEYTVAGVSHSQLCLPMTEMTSLTDVMCMNDPSRSEIVLDRMQSTFVGNTSAYGSFFNYRMNCYGYALQIHSLAGSASDNYKQQPGEFYKDQQTYLYLLTEYHLQEIAGTASTYFQFVKNKMINDFSSLNGDYGAEWTIALSSATETMPSGYRKIALVVAFNGELKDYHFYLRHSDGTWSHKRGASSITNRSCDSNVVITDSNINTVATEAGYTEGICYYKIKKSAVIDYPHVNGHGDSTLYTSMSLRDCAGEKKEKSRVVTGGYTAAKFAYPRDEDYYAFTPTATTTYTFTTSLSGSTYNVDIFVYDKYGNQIAADTSSSNASVTVSLNAGQRYFIRVYDVNQSLVPYVFYHY